MELCVNATLLSGTLADSLIRLAGQLAPLKRSFNSIGTHGDTPSALMVTVAYLPRARFKVIPNRDNIFQVEVGCIDVEDERGLRAGDLIDRAPPEPSDTELLHFLALHQNQVFTREQLLEKVWGFDYFGDSRTVDVHIKRLREKLPDSERFNWTIRTVWSVGYKFEIK